MFKKIKHPILFQGNLNSKKYFEGWYYKQVTADQKIRLSFIPGISLNEKDSHSFIQYIIVNNKESGEVITHTGYVRYEVNEFLLQESPFRVQIGKSVFTEDFIALDVKDENFSFKGLIQLGSFHPLKCSRIQPNIMGPFAYIPKMQCYHGVISMMHKLSGSLEINGKALDFSNGKGYIEKDWGTSFPKEYIWLHSNHFENPLTSLFFSIAHIPFYGTEFEGFICNLVIADKEYRFATYNQSSYTIQEISADSVNIRLENKKVRLDLIATVSGQGQLIAPVEGTMEKTIKEGISGVIKLRLEEKETGKVYQDVGRNAGVEIVDYS